MDPVLTTFSFLIRIISGIYCLNKAEKLNKPKSILFLFGFITPLITIIWILYKTKKDKRQITKVSIENNRNI